MRKILWAGCLVAMLGAVPALAGSDVPNKPNNPLEDAERLGRHVAEKLMETLRFILRAVPQYEMPEITKDGDIIIRRKRPESGGPPKSGKPPESGETPESEEDSTRT